MSSDACRIAWQNIATCTVKQHALLDTAEKVEYSTRYMYSIPKYILYNYIPCSSKIKFY